MRLLLTVTALCLTVFLMGCQNGQSSTSTEMSPGAVAECGVNCDKPCCAAKEGDCCGTCGGTCGGAAKEAACCGTCGGEAPSPGALGECGSSCSKPCGATKEAKCCGTCGGEAPSPGALGDPAHGGCPVTGQPAPGALGDAPCTSSCSGK